MMWRNRLALALAAAIWPFGVQAEMTEADCAAFVRRLQGIGGGYQLANAQPVLADGWCQLDGATLRGKATSVPDISARALRVRGVGLGGDMTSLEVQALGVKAAPRIGDRGMDDRLRSFLRMQTADVAFRVDWNREADMLELREGVLSLPGRNRLTLGADIKGTDLSSGASLFVGAVTALDLQLVTDGRIARPMMEMAGERMLPKGADKGEAVAAVRDMLVGVVEAMPGEVLDQKGRFALATMLAGLPQTTGTMRLALRSERGISAAQVAVNGLRANPLHPRALATLFRGVELTIDWQPGAAQ